MPQDQLTPPFTDGVEMMRARTLVAVCAGALLAATSVLSSATAEAADKPGDGQLRGTAGAVHDQGRVNLYAPASNQIVELKTGFVVPPKPSEVGTTFLWPGLEPVSDGVNFEPIGTGVLQPVLTWGPSCAPAAGKPADSDAYSSWWISGQYVNTLGSDPGYEGCFSGPAMLVKPGDRLEVDMKLDSASGQWVQTVADGAKRASFSFGLQGQAQNRVMFYIENYDGAPFAGPLSFSHTTVTFAKADGGSTCGSWAAVPGVSGVRSVADGRKCVIKTATVAL
ncbi:hypothetical protein LN042_09130 [Kitasatospora sp. RB6PN24]|uniref:hypothetical protein n=1 Tax=Kitasatospora humi TaxID=2893891 RepID=UPI001E29AB0B|nr:hypothetical protein [Kitasatospora humi]MCC9307263.1 hypothetical protein [Kitasatospora humi]